jgi:hypothetical protein
MNAEKAHTVHEGVFPHLLRRVGRIGKPSNRLKIACVEATWRAFRWRSVCLSWSPPLTCNRMGKSPPTSVASLCPGVKKACRPAMQAVGGTWHSSSVSGPVARW